MALARASSLQLHGVANRIATKKQGQHFTTLSDKQINEVVHRWLSFVQSCYPSIISIIFKCMSAVLLPIYHKCYPILHLKTLLDIKKWQAIIITKISKTFNYSIGYNVL